MKRQPRCISVTLYADGLIQIRIGSSHVEWSGMDRYWAMIWARAYGQAENLPIRMTISNELPMPELEIKSLDELKALQSSNTDDTDEIGHATAK